MQPSDFTSHPYGSISQNCETEKVAANIMRILARTGNVFRPIGWEEYESERLKDKDFDPSEKTFFEMAKEYCESEESANEFCPDWHKLK